MECERNSNVMAEFNYSYTHFAIRPGKLVLPFTKYTLNKLRSRNKFFSQFSKLVDKGALGHVFLQVASVLLS
jgi:hypothetical protein